MLNKLFSVSFLIVGVLLFSPTSMGGVETDIIKTSKGEITQQTYKNRDGSIGQIKRTLNDELEGAQENFDYKGRLSELVNYSGGVKHGVSSWFNENGTLRFSETYVNGKKVGAYSSTPEGYQGREGTEVSDAKHYAIDEGHYDENGKKTGSFNRYLALMEDVVADGEKYEKRTLIQGEYQNGVKVGNWKYFDKTGLLIDDEVFANDANPIGTRKKYFDGTTQLKSFREYNEKDALGYIKEYYPNGKLRKLTNFKDKKAHGMSQEYYESGVLMSEGNLLDGERFGLWKLFYENGLIFQESTFTEVSRTSPFKKIEYDYTDDGKLKSIITRDNFNKNKNDGVYRYADTLSKYYNVENGSLREIKTEKQFEYENGNVYEKKHGLYQYYTSDGKLVTDGNYNKGEKHGVWKSYHSGDLLRELTTYENGERLGAFEDHEYYKNNTRSKSVVGIRSGDRTSQRITYFYENGQIEEAGDYLRVYTKGSKQDGREGEWKSYYESGNLKSVKKYLKGDRHGDWKSYYESGKPISIGSYVEGAKHGEWKLYYESGFPEEAGRYVNGFEQGEWVYYYENNKVQSTGAYLPLNDKTAHLIDELEEAKEGVWKYFDENGKLIEQTTFQVSDDYQYLIKEQKEYGENGKLKSEATFHNEVVAGTHKEYFESGALKYKTVFGENNECIGENFYEDGVLERYTEYYCEGVELTPKVAKQYHENGKLLIEVTYDEYGDVFNLLQYFGFNGDPLEIGSLKDGNGTVNAYNDDNKLIRVDTYSAGELIESVDH